MYRFLVILYLKKLNNNIYIVINQKKRNKYRKFNINPFFPQKFSGKFVLEFCPRKAIFGC